MSIAIIGANGVVGTTLTQELIKGNNFDKLVLYARSYSNKIDGKVIYKKINALNKVDVENSLKGINLVYLTIGLLYKISVWQNEWPLIISNVLHACEKNKTKLVFFDNVYEYGFVNGTMTESTPVNPSSIKGIVRQKLSNMIKSAIANRKVTAVIAKSADYYGPHAKQSLLYVNMIENLIKGKTPAWLGNPKKLHSFTYLPDAARALIELGLSNEANNQVWHLPTKEPLTGENYIKFSTAVFKMPNKFITYQKLMMRFIGLFNPVVKELIEMFYQFDNDYVFSSRKFENTFKTKPTPYKEGIEKMIQSFV